MTTIFKALGKHYFTVPHCPIAVQTVAAASCPQHEHDLTDVIHYHDFAELVVVTSGSGTQVINKMEYPVSAGDVFLLQGFCGHAFREREKVGLLNIQFAPAALPLPLVFLRKIPGYNVMFQLEPTMRTPRSFKHRLRLDEEELSQLAAMTGALQGELFRKDAGFEAAAFNRLLEIIIFVSRRHSAIHADNQAALVRMGDVISRLESDFAADWTLAKIARIAKTSPNNLLRLFKAATGESPIDCLIRIRLQRAAEMLVSSDLSVTEIAFACGFHDPNYFTRRFTLFFHQSPRDHRKSR